jgi:hypothetical protein
MGHIFTRSRNTLTDAKTLPCTTIQHRNLCPLDLMHRANNTSDEASLQTEVAHLSRTFTKNSYLPKQIHRALWPRGRLRGTDSKQKLISNSISTVCAEPIQPCQQSTDVEHTGLIPDEVTGFFNWPNPSSCTMFLGVKGSRHVRLTTSLPPVSWLSRKCGSLDASQPYGPVTVCYRNSFTSHLPLSKTCCILRPVKERQDLIALGF